MNDEVLLWTAIGLGLTGVGAGVLCRLTWPRGPRCRCPGPRPRWLLRWTPRPLLWRGRCWYDLTGLMLGHDGFVRCPECGERVGPDDIKMEGRRLRWGRLAIILLVLGAASYGTLVTRNGTWVRPLPTVTLAVMERQSGINPTHHDVRREVRRRIRKGGVRGWSATMLAHAVKHELSHDDVKWNAHSAAEMLRALWPESRPALEDMLAREPQARVMAAAILRRACPDDPSDALLRACVEDLCDDNTVVDWSISRGNAASATSFLLDRTERAEPYLVDALRTGDWQQQLVSAAILAYAGHVEHADEAAPILIDHLRDNTTRGDAMVAAPALFRFGPGVIPHLEPAARSDDDQLRESALAIIERIEHPDRPLRRVRNRMPGITTATHDPLRKLSLTRSVGQLRGR